MDVVDHLDPDLGTADGQVVVGLTGVAGEAVLEDDAAGRLELNPDAPEQKAAGLNPVAGTNFRWT